ncbi:MAG: hypothetical protein WA672_08555 [Candidatus Angelobacter sp.]
MKKCFWMMVGITLLGSTIAFAQDEPPSLGELAAKQKKQNKTTRKPEKFYTEADLPSRPAATGKAASVAPAANTSGDKTSGQPTASTQGNDSTKKPGPASNDSHAVAELKKQIESYQQNEDMWKKSAQRYEDLLANETNDFRRQTYEEALENDRKNAALYQQKVDQAQTALSNAQKTASSSSSSSSASPPGQP